MRFEDLQAGDVFTIDGAPYEAKTKGERIVLAYLLHPSVLKTTHAPQFITSKRLHDPADLAGDQYLTTAFSDLRFDKNNLTDFERACDEELKLLL